MEWFFLAITSALFFSINGVASKILIDKRFEKPFPFSIFLTIIDCIFFFGVYVLVPTQFYYPYGLYSMVIGALISYCFYFYYHAMKNDEGSRAVSLMQTHPLLTVVLSAIILGEILKIGQYVGIALLVMSSVIISHKKTEGGRKRSAALKHALVFALMVSLYNIATKYILGYMDYWSYFFWGSMGVLLNVFFLLLVKSIRTDFFALLGAVNKKTVLVCTVKEGLWMGGDLLSLAAFSLGPVSIVSALGSLQPFFVLIIATGISLFLPHILKEDIERQHLLEKLMATVLIFVGLWLLNVV